MGYREELIELVQIWTEDKIDITDNWSEWETFLTKQGYIKTYSQVYEMDLAHLQSCGHDYGGTYIKENGEWDVETLIENDEDITEMSNGCFFVHNQSYIDEYIIDKFYEQQKQKRKQKALNRTITQAYFSLDKSNDGLDKLKSLLTIFKNNFGNEIIYLTSSVEKTKENFVKCINNILKIRNDWFGDDYGYYWINILNKNSSDIADLQYVEILRHIGYQNFCQDGKIILKSDFIILKDDDSNQDAYYFTYQNIEEFVNYIEDVLSIIYEECDNIDIKYVKTINEDINNEINEYWKNWVDFDYANFYENN